MAKLEPDMPMNCSAEIFASMSDASIVHQGNAFPAKKIIPRILLMTFFLPGYLQTQTDDKDDIAQKDANIKCRKLHIVPVYLINYFTTSTIP